MTAVLIAFGPNDVEVPCLVFESWEKGLKECTEEIFKAPPSGSNEDSAWWNETYEGGEGGQSHFYFAKEWVDRSPKELKKIAEDETRYRRKLVTIDDLSERDKKKPIESEVPISRFFVSFYGGCGGVANFTLKKIEFGKPFTCFNLD